MATAKKSAAKKTAKKAAAKRMGRPPKPEAERKSVSLNLRVTAAEKEALERAAESLGLSMTTLVLRAVDSFVTKSR